MHRVVFSGIDRNSASPIRNTGWRPQRFPMRVTAFYFCARAVRISAPAITSVGWHTQHAGDRAAVPLTGCRGWALCQAGRRIFSRNPCLPRPARALPSLTGRKKRSQGQSAVSRCILTATRGLPGIVFRWKKASMSFFRSVVRCGFASMVALCGLAIGRSPNGTD